MPSSEEKEGNDIPIAAALLSALSDLLFCPNFTIGPPSTVNLYTQFDFYFIFISEHRKLVSIG